MLLESNVPDHFYWVLQHDCEFDQTFSASTLELYRDQARITLLELGVVIDQDLVERLLHLRVDLEPVNFIRYFPDFVEFGYACFAQHLVHNLVVEFRDVHGVEGLAASSARVYVLEALVPVCLKYFPEFCVVLDEILLLRVHVLNGLLDFFYHFILFNLKLLLTLLHGHIL